MSTLIIWTGKASMLTVVRDMPGPHRIADRKHAAKIQAMLEVATIRETGDYSPLTRVLVTDSTGRALAGYYVNNMEETRV